MAYLGKTPSQAVRSRYYFTASGGETSLSPSEVTSLSFTDANYVDVSLNGVALVSGTDYTATPSTNTISGLAALTASDVVEIVVYDTFSVFGGNVNGDFNISGGDLTLGDNDKAVFGAGSDLQIYHDSNNSYITEGGDQTGDLFIRASNLKLTNASGDFFLWGRNADSVRLYHNNAQKLETTATGIDVTGNATFDDNGKAIFGAGSDLQIYHNGTDSYIDDAGTGDLYIRASDDLRLQVRNDTNTAWVSSVIANDGGETSLHYNGTKKIYTTSSGIDVTGTVTADGLTVENTSSATASLVAYAGTQDAEVQIVAARGNVSGPDSRLKFYTNNGTSLVQRVDIDDTGDISFYADNGTTQGFFWDASTQRLGLGNTNPATTLDVTGTVTAGAGTHTFGDGTGTSQLVLLAGTTGNSTLDFGDSADSNIGRIEYEHTNDALTFRTNNSERVRITSDGNVGIGTSSPGGSLEVYKAGTSEVLIGTDNGGTAQLSLYESDDGTKEGLLKYDGTNNRIHLATSGAPNALVIPRDSGNVGIGTTDPVSKFNVDTGDVVISRTTDGDGNELGEFMFWNRTNAGSGTGTTYVNDVASIQGKMVGTGNNSGGSLHFYTKPDAGDKNERMRIDGSGNIEFGSFSFTGASGGALIEKGSTEYAIRTSTTLTSSRIHYDFYNTNGRVGSIATSGSSTAYNTSSDHRLKENVTDMTGAIDRVKALAPKRFNFIADDTVTVDGFIAHEAQAVVPEAVTGTHNEVDDDGNAVMQGIDQSKLVPLLTGALREAIAKIETLETQRADLEARLTALENAE